MSAVASAGHHPEPVRPPVARPVGIDDLSPRERDVVRHIAAGLDNEEIGRTLCLSVHTVKTYVRSVYRKIGAERRSQAIVWAIRHGLLDIPGVTVVIDENVDTIEHGDHVRP